MHCRVRRNPKDVICLLDVPKKSSNSWHKEALLSISAIMIETPEQKSTNMECAIIVGCTSERSPAKRGLHV